LLLRLQQLGVAGGLGRARGLGFGGQSSVQLPVAALSGCAQSPPQTWLVPAANTQHREKRGMCLGISLKYT